MSPDPDIVIIGGGLEGLSTAWALALRGERNVLVLERHSQCSGGTAKSSGIVRCHYGVPSLAAMAWMWLQVFENASDLLDVDIGFRQTGYVVGVGSGNVAALEANVAMHRQLGIDVQMISHDGTQELWPHANLADFAAFAYEPASASSSRPCSCHSRARSARVLSTLG